MTCLGLRCSNKDYSYAVMSGTKVTPVVIHTGTISMPKGYSHPQSLKWFLQELEALHKEHGIDQWAMKGTETIAAKGNSFVDRVENEAMVFLMAANLGTDNICRKVNATIAKNLTGKGSARYLKTDLDISLISDYATYNDKLKDAIHVAWSCL